MHSRRFAAWLAVTIGAALGAARGEGVAYAAVTVTGTVFEDVDGSGSFTAGDVPVPNCVVFWETTVGVRTDAQGRYTMSVPSDGIVWVRTPDGFSPAPSWHAISVAGGNQTADLPLTRSTATGPVTFIHGSDTHIGPVDAAAAIRTIAQATAMEPAPHFLVITGDLTQDAIAPQFDAMKQALAGIGVPFVPVPGNHDWYDGGALYRKYFGPTSYSFDAGGVHFVVIETPSGDWSKPLAFLDRDLPLSPPGTPVALFTHFPPAWNSVDAVFTAGAKQRGVRWLFSGHWHQNRVLDYNGLPDFNVHPMIMGGVDLTPGGYRIVTIEDGVVHMIPHTSVEAPVVREINPLPGTCVPPGQVEIIAAVETGPTAVDVTATVDNGVAVPLVPRGGWDYSAKVTITIEGTHHVRLAVEAANAKPRYQTSTICVRTVSEPPPVLGEWPQLQGSPRHEGATTRVQHGPLRSAWAVPVGGHLRGGSPVLSEGRLFVPVIDPGLGDRGGVVALDAATGAFLWEWRGRPVHNAPAVAEGLVIIATANGVVQAHRVATGELVWEYNLADGLPQVSSNLFAAPTIDDGVVYVGVVRNLAALDVATGRPLWERNPSTVWPDATFAAVAIDAGVGVGVFGRGYEGIKFFDAYTGADLQPTGPASLSIGTSASPIIAAGKVYSADSATTVYSLDLLTHGAKQITTLDSHGFDWGYWVAATPALADGKLFIPTQESGFHAISVPSGLPVWRVEAGASVVHPVHYRATSHAFSSSPVVTGDTVWIGGADGVLLGLDIVGGEQRVRMDLGAPILSGVVPGGDMLFVATWDGTVHGFRDVGNLPPPPPDPATVPPGCQVGGSQPGEVGWVALVTLLALAFLRRRFRPIR